MGLKDLFKKTETLISIDIGSTSIKFLELDTSGTRSKVVHIASVPLSGEIFSNNAISQSSKVAEQISSVIEKIEVTERRVVTAVPGPSAFTKRIKMPKMDLGELGSNVQYEAGNFIPHNINAVKLDFHILGESGKNQLDVLVAAVKNEIVDSFLDCIGLSGLEVAVVDIDYFALQNAFELSYPELVEKTVALVNIGARYSSINICRGGQTLFTGDISIGGKAVTDAIVEVMGVPFDEAEKMKCSLPQSDPKYAALKHILEGQAEHVAGELNRQLSFFWNATGSDEGIDLIMLSGGGAELPGLVDQLKEKTGISCNIMDPFANVDPGESISSAELSGFGPKMAIVAGLAIREPGDKIIPDFE